LKKTITAPFSARAVPGGPVSYPISPKDLEDPKLSPSRFDVRSAPTKVKQLKKILYLSELAQSLESAFAKLGIKT
jgi:DNA primase